MPLYCSFQAMLCLPNVIVAAPTPNSPTQRVDRGKRKTRIKEETVLAKTFHILFFLSSFVSIYFYLVPLSEKLRAFLRQTTCCNLQEKNTKSVRSDISIGYTALPLKRRYRCGGNDRTHCLMFKPVDHGSHLNACHNLPARS